MLSKVLQAQVIGRTVLSDGIEMMRIDGIGGANTNVFQTVKYRNQYEKSPVVACNLLLPRVIRSSSDQVAANEDIGVIRLDKVTKQSFKIKVMPYSSTVTMGATTASCMVAERGAHSIPNKDGKDINYYADTFIGKYNNIATGTNLAASKRANKYHLIANSTVAAHLKTTSPALPALLSQVMTNKNPDTFLTAWNHFCGSSDAIFNYRTYPAQASDKDGACVSLHQGGYDLIDESEYKNEKVGFIAIDNGTGVTPDNIRYRSFYSKSELGGGVGDIDSAEDFSKSLEDTYQFVVADQNGEIGGHMSWLVLHNIDDALANKKFRYAFDDYTRTHAKERFSGFLASQSKVDLRLNKAVSTPTPAIGSTVTFTLEVKNDGPDTARDVLVNDRLPAGFAYVDKSMTGGNQMSVNADQLTWEIEQLATNESIMLSFDATVASPTP